MTDGDNINHCKDCLVGIGEIQTKLTMLEKAYSDGWKISNANLMKILYALLGMMGAQIGTKFIGTPLHVEIAMYTLMTSSIFVLAITIAKWRCLIFWEKWIRLNFVLLCFWVTGLRIYHYQTHTDFTQTEGVITQLITTSLAIGFIVLAWQRDALRNKMRRRYSDQ